MKRLFPVSFVILAGAFTLFAAQQVSEDRDLKEINLTGWPCLNRPEGSIQNPEGMERNRLKNRVMPPTYPVPMKLDVIGFMNYVAAFDAQTKSKKRAEVTGDPRKKLNELEKQVVELTGYLGVAYCGPSESTNCKSVDFHDWHLEVFEKPPTHPPQPGDPTAIVCEITPRTQNDIYRSNIRIQELAAFFRAADMSYQPTGHPARKIKLTGFLLWDDEHNKADQDIGTAVRTAPERSYHQPWRETAWELHPVLKIQLADAAAPTGLGQPSPEQSASPPPAGETPAGNSPPTPAPSVAESEAPSPSIAPTATATVTPTPAQFVTVTQAVHIRIPYGETVLPRGARLPVVSHDAHNITVQYLGRNQTIPISSTDFSAPPAP